MKRIGIALITLCATAACDRPPSDERDAIRVAAMAPGGEAAPGPIETAPDTAIPDRIAASLARFREGLGDDPGTLGPGASPDRDELVERYVHALETSDSAAFGAMIISRSEFAWLYYPYSSYIRPPYALDPDVAWLLIRENAHKGIGRALREYGGRPLAFSGYRCNPQPVTAGPNRLWEGCVVDIVIDGQPATVRLFGSILERDGRFRFMSYANEL